MVLGGIVTPIPVTLDGQTQTVTVPMEAITYTAGSRRHAHPADGQVRHAVPESPPYGVINISSMQLVLPTVGPAAHVTPEFPSASASQPLVLAGAMAG